MKKMKIRPEDLIMITDSDKRMELETEYMKAEKMGQNIIRFEGIEYTRPYVEALLDWEINNE
jgi:hypothetical protein